jgi:hypothetical protein
MATRDWVKQRGWLIPTLVGIALMLTGFFSPWIDHPVAGLALTGFEIGEWIKFAPEVRAGTVSLSRSGFYWSAAAAAVGLAVVAAGVGPHRRIRWLLLASAAGVALLPFPLVEEITSRAGMQANWPRFGLIALGLVAVGAVAGWGRRMPQWTLGVALVVMGAGGLVVASATFVAAEPIVERIYHRLIDPGVGLILVQAGLIALAGGGVWQIKTR